MVIPSHRDLLKFVVGLLLASQVFSAQAGVNLSAEEVKALLSDKTVFAKHEKDRYTFIDYFAPDGSAKQLADTGEKKTGSWRVESDGTFCVSWVGDSDPVCGPLIASGEGQYKRMRINPRNIMGGLIHVVTFQRFENGNSKGLE
jgi:hypothetical protein